MIKKILYVPIFRIRQLQIISCIACGHWMLIYAIRSTYHQGIIIENTLRLTNHPKTYGFFSAWSSFTRNCRTSKFIDKGLKPFSRCSAYLKVFKTFEFSRHAAKSILVFSKVCQFKSVSDLRHAAKSILIFSKVCQLKVYPLQGPCWHGFDQPHQF